MDKDRLVSGLAVFLVGLSLALLMAACGSESSPVSTTTTEAAETVEGIAPSGTYPVTRVTVTWTTPQPDLTGVSLQTSGEDWPMAVAYPDTDGRPPFGWPVVVAFHGSTLGTPFDGLDDLASRGVVVVVPRWAPPEWTATNLDVLDPADYADGYWFDVAACALAAAQEVAVDYDGNPGQTTVVGFSAGVHPAARTALGTPRTDYCPERDPAIRPSAMVVGDSQWLFQGEPFDVAFEQPDSPAVDTVDRILNPDRWVSLSPSFRVYLWSTQSTAWAREVANRGFAPADSWLSTRSFDSTKLIEDLEQVGAFDDGRILFDDNARLLEMRLESEGIKVIHEVFPTYHTYADGVYDRIVEIVFGVGFN